MFDQRQKPGEDAGDADGYVTPEPIRLLVNPGTASSGEIAELFLAISDLYKACGGHGLNVEVTGKTIDGKSVVEMRPITYGPIDQPPHSFRKE